MIHNLIGGGAGLNLKVVGGTTQPTSPAENTVWVDTDTAINGYAISATEPENPVEGMVWIVSGSLKTPINAGKKNVVEFYPANAYQYISGNWVKKEAKTYQGGAWVDWAKILFANDAYGSGFSKKAFEETTVTITNKVLTATGAIAAFNLTPAVNLSNYSTLEVEFEASGDIGNYDGHVAIGVNKTNVWSDGGETYAAKYFTREVNLSRRTISVDISALSGSYYFAVSSYAINGMTLKFYNIKFY